MRQQQEEEEQQMWEELEKDLTLDERFEIHKKIYPFFKERVEQYAKRYNSQAKRAIRP